MPTSDAVEKPPPRRTGRIQKRLNYEVSSSFPKIPIQYQLKKPSNKQPIKPSHVHVPPTRSHPSVSHLELPNNDPTPSTNAEEEALHTSTPPERRDVNPHLQATQERNEQAAAANLPKRPGEARKSKADHDAAIANITARKYTELADVATRRKEVGQRIAQLQGELVALEQREKEIEDKAAGDVGREVLRMGDGG